MHLSALQKRADVLATDLDHCRRLAGWVVVGVTGLGGWWFGPPGCEDSTHLPATHVPLNHDYGRIQ